MIYTIPLVAARRTFVFSSRHACSRQWRAKRRTYLERENRSLIVNNLACLYWCIWYIHQALSPYPTPDVPGEILLLVRTPELSARYNKTYTLYCYCATECRGLRWRKFQILSVLTSKQQNIEIGKVMTTNTQTHPVTNFSHRSAFEVSSTERRNGLNDYWYNHSTIIK